MQTLNSIHLMNKKVLTPSHLFLGFLLNFLMGFFKHLKIGEKKIFLGAQAPLELFSVKKMMKKFERIITCPLLLQLVP